MVMTPNSTRCKYAITIERNPNASWLKDGMVEPSCNDNFIVKAKAHKLSNHLLSLLNFSDIICRCLKIDLTKIAQAMICKQPATTTNM